MKAVKNIIVKPSELKHLIHQDHQCDTGCISQYPLEKQNTLCVCVCVCVCSVSTCVWVFFLSVGKTSLLHRFVHKTFYEDYQTTLGASILSKIIILDDTTLKLQVSRPLIPSSTYTPEYHPTFPGRPLTQQCAPGARRV